MDHVIADHVIQGFVDHVIPGRQSQSPSGGKRETSSLQIPSSFFSKRRSLPEASPPADNHQRYEIF